MTIIDIPVRERIFVGLDDDSYREARATVDIMIDLGITNFKIGKMLINRGKAGKIARYIIKKGGQFFLDNKDIDIGNTMAGGMKSAGALGATWSNMMCEAGVRRLKLAQAAAGDVKTIGVTVLTDMDDDECQAIYGDKVAPTARRFAGYAEEAGLWGTVSSADDLQNFADHGVATSLVKVTPAIRPIWAPPNDQKRFTTPTEAFRAGADMLVTARPLLRPPESFQGKRIATPEVATKLFIEECEESLA